MLQTSCIGNLGGNAEVKNANGKKFTTFRIAHTDKWTDDAGKAHEETIWVDCLLNGEPAVVEYLKRGQQVFVTGSTSVRVYSSAKDRCMKAGLTINVRSIELLGGKKDDVPTQLTNPADGKVYDTRKYFHIPEFVNPDNSEGVTVLQSRSGQKFSVDGAGWVNPIMEEQL